MPPPWYRPGSCSFFTFYRVVSHFSPVSCIVYFLSNWTIFSVRDDKLQNIDSFQQHVISFLNSCIYLKKLNFFFKGSCSSLEKKTTTTGLSCSLPNKPKVLAAWLILWLPPPHHTESPRRGHRDVRLCGWAEREDKPDDRKTFVVAL